MKKLVLTSALAVAVSGAAFAQGTIQWNGISPVGFTTVTNTTVSSPFSVGGSTALTGGTSGATAIGAGGYYFELLYNTSATKQSTPTTIAGLASWGDTGLEAGNSTASAGKWTTTVGSTTPAGAVAALTPGVSYSFMAVAWSANLGTTWAQVSAALNSPSILAADALNGPDLFGASNVGFLALGSANPGTVVIGSAAGQLTSLLTPLEPIVSTPEPTTIALGVMGAASLLAFRRKKA